jgi:hypothetical protein
MNEPVARFLLRKKHSHAPAGGFFLLVLSVQQVSYIAQLFGGVLQSLYLLPELRLLGLFLAENFVDILHEIPS